MKKLIICLCLLQSCAMSPYYLPKTLLEDSFKNTHTHVMHEETQGRTRIIFPKSTTFKPKSAVLSPQLMNMLDRIAAIMGDYPAISVAVHGYTDSKGEPLQNQALSERRAHAAISYLESQGVSPSRLITHGHGMHNPRYNSNSSDDYNRRIEITVHTAAGSYID